MWELTDRNQKKKCSFNSVHYKINHTYIEIILRPVSWGLTVCAAIEKERRNQMATSSVTLSDKRLLGVDGP